MKNFTKNKKKIKKIRRSKKHIHIKKNNKAGALTEKDAEQLWNIYNTDINQFNSIIQNLDFFQLNHLFSLIPDYPQFQVFKQEIFNELSRKNSIMMYSQNPQQYAFKSPHKLQHPLKSDGSPDMRFKQNKQIVENQSFKSIGKSKLNPLAREFVAAEPDPKIMLTQHALERMSERNISESIIISIIKQKNYETGRSEEGPVRIYKGHLDQTKNLYKIITSDEDNPTIITVIQDKDMFTEKAILSMIENNISEKQVLNIIQKNQPNRVKGNKQGDRLEYTSTHAGVNIKVYTNIENSKIIGIIVKNMRSLSSQPNITHIIDYETEGCALQRTTVPQDNWQEVDCGRCAMSYAGIGSSVSRSKLQNMCVKDQGLLKKQVNKWLKEEAKRDYSRHAARLYYIHPDFINSKLKSMPIKQSVIASAVEVSNKLLGLNQQVVAFYDCLDSGAHIFNIGKTENDNTVWYICPQSGLNPGQLTLKDKFNSMHGGQSITQVLFVLQPWQAELLLDENRNSLVISVTDYEKLQQGGKKTIKKRKRNYVTKKISN